jgi:anti-sigma factor RsiW
LHVGRLIEARLHPRRARWRIAAAILLALSAGGAGGWFARAAQRPNDIAWLTLQAASAHRVFAADDVTQVPPDDPATLRHWMSDRLGQPASVPDLSPMGYRFRGGRVLAAVGGPAAMLIYDAADGARVTIYVQPMRGALVTPMRPVEDHAIGGYAWIARQIGYSVMSADDASAAAQSAIHRLANQVRDQMATPS